MLGSGPNIHVQTNTCKRTITCSSTAGSNRLKPGSTAGVLKFRQSVKIGLRRTNEEIISLIPDNGHTTKFEKNVESHIAGISLYNLSRWSEASHHVLPHDYMRKHM